MAAAENMHKERQDYARGLKSSSTIDEKALFTLS